MRAKLFLLSPSLLALAACGGGGDTGTVSAGTVAAPAGGTSTTGSGGTTPAPSSGATGGGAGGGATGGTPAPTPTPGPSVASNLFDVSAATTFDAMGALQSLTVNKDRSTLYAGHAGTVADPSGTITYNPRDGVFTVELNDAAVNVTKKINFQDPYHRNTVDVARNGQWQVPLLAGYNYLQSLDGGTEFTFFYQRPGQSGAFVSLAGYERSEINATTGVFTSDQGAMVFGAKTPTLGVPTKGTGRYEGQFLATMVGMADGSRQVLQWIDGASAADIDFGKRTVALSLNGTVGPAYIKTLDGTVQTTIRVNDAALSFPTGSVFTATGTAGWAQSGTAFQGKFSQAGFTIGGVNVAVDFTAVSAGGAVAGASSIDGTFYGPDAKNLGGNFRIVGGVPNQRIDILGAFAGAKK